MNNFKTFLEEGNSMPEMKPVKLKDLSTNQFTKIMEKMAKTDRWVRRGGGTEGLFYLRRTASNDPERELRIILHKNGKWELLGSLDELSKK